MTRSTVFKPTRGAGPDHHHRRQVGDAAFDFPGADDIKADIQKAVSAWGLDRDGLNARCREIWSSGWRPGMSADGEVGSGADVDDRDG